MTRARQADGRPQPLTEMFMERHKDSIELLAPVAGAALGALALEAMSQHVNMKKHEIALLGAGVAFLAATSSQGATRQLAMGAAAASACYGAVEFLRGAHPDWLYKQPKAEPQPPQQAAPPDAITHAELERVLAQLQKRHQEEMTKAHHEYESKIAEMRGVIQSLHDQLKRKRDANEPKRRAPAAPAVVAANSDPVVRAKVDTVKERLSPEERYGLDQAVSRLSPEQRAHLEQEVFRRPLDESVEYLRTQVIVGPNGHARA